jgi:pyroglutamyl-peptidase
MRALVTGFEGFDGKVNPSGQIAKGFDGKTFGELEIVGRELPEDFQNLPRILRNLTTKIRPDILISTGWDYIAKFKVERVALNIQNSEFGDKVVPDNRGNAPSGNDVISGAPLALRASMPTEKILNVFQKSRIPAYVSYSAGTHCCNTVMYSGIYYSQKINPKVLAGFIHIPPTPEMNVPKDRAVSFGLKEEKRAIKKALICCRDFLVNRRKP